MAGGILNALSQQQPAQQSAPWVPQYNPNAWQSASGLHRFAPPQQANWWGQPVQMRQYQAPALSPFSLPQVTPSNPSGITPSGGYRGGSGQSTWMGSGSNSGSYSGGLLGQVIGQQQAAPVQYIGTGSSSSAWGPYSGGGDYSGYTTGSYSDSSSGD